MGSSGAYSFRRLTLAHLHDNPPLFATGRRKSSSTAQPRPSITSATIGVGDPFIPYYHYRKPPSRPPSRPPSKPPSNRNSAALSRHNTVRSHQFAFAYDENIGRVKWEEYNRREGIEDVPEQPIVVRVPIWRRILKLLKILLPHVGLNVLLLSYIAMGATVFIWLEADHELEGRKAKVKHVFDIYSQIMNETIALTNNQSDQATIVSRMRPLLESLSRAHEYDDKFTDTNQLWTGEQDGMTTRWTFAAATLYALTVITSTGYDHVTPATDPGRIFTVFFGLIGIPLMFITAADIGKFLSEIVIRTYAKLLAMWKMIANLVELVRTHLFDTDVDSIDSMELKKSKKRNASSLDDEECEDEEDRLQLPIASYFTLIIGYCCVGSLLFNTFEKGPVWSFIHGVFFSFNTITTIGLGNIRVQQHYYLALAVSYVIIGLAVITASLDLCSSTLKRTFTKLHYFGRKIRGARRGFANMSDDIREAMRIIAALKKTRPSKDRITLEDLKRFLEVQEHLLRQPYVPYNVHLLRWIEDNVGPQMKNEFSLAEQYAQYMDDVSGGKTPMSPSRLSHKMSSSDPMLFF
ncbi:Potassium channel domain-containing protein [Caenorhabditis elegans]|uniref:Potassium channel domain-containing protein n=1 Tax=Caenorhabditis elegans TaxID=6239 RepID=O76791_CAEEL|nr:Potassium channel domain-containing protein [Caenorhabditis elegans]AAC32858.1 putative potassium channel subunit n2P17m2-2 [Caenorhabditis elegans]CCD67335.1 Potassium channel domain-containing protein [Caenorhabditis elegans]|eukprot:NP_001024464.1 TWiK family of potassium channels [Caenorhabditis elegans]